MDDPHDEWRVGTLWGWNAVQWINENDGILERVGQMLDGDEEEEQS